MDPTSSSSSPLSSLSRSSKDNDFRLPPYPPTANQRPTASSLSLVESEAERRGNIPVVLQLGELRGIVHFLSHAGTFCAVVPQVITSVEMTPENLITLKHWTRIQEGAEVEERPFAACLCEAGEVARLSSQHCQRTLSHRSPSPPQGLPWGLPHLHNDSHRGSCFTCRMNTIIFVVTCHQQWKVNLRSSPPFSGPISSRRFSWGKNQIPFLHCESVIHPPILSSVLRVLSHQNWIEFSSYLLSFLTLAALRFSLVSLGLRSKHFSISPIPSLLSPSPNGGTDECVLGNKRGWGWGWG